MLNRCSVGYGGKRHYHYSSWDQPARKLVGFFVCINKNMKETKITPTSTDKLVDALTTTVNMFNVALFITLIYQAGQFMLIGLLT